MFKKILLLFVISLFSLDCFSSVKLIIAPSTEYISFYKKDIDNYLSIRKEGFRTDIELKYPEVYKDINDQMHFIETNINSNKLFINKSKKVICRIGFSIANNSESEVIMVKKLADNGTKICDDVEKYLKKISKKYPELKYIKAAKAKGILSYDIFYIVY